jgi:hypothetical protein
MQRLKISKDPLFGVTVYQIGGLFYYRTTPVLAFCSRAEPFSQLSLAGISPDARREIADGMFALIRNLDDRNKAAIFRSSVGEERPVRQLLEFLQAIQDNPRHANARIHLLMERREGGAWNADDVQEFLAGQPSIQLQLAPWVRGGRNWSRWVECWLRHISDWPLQTNFVNSAYQMSGLLRPRRSLVGPLVVC